MSPKNVSPCGSTVDGLVTLNKAIEKVHKTNGYGCKACKPQRYLSLTNIRYILIIVHKPNSNLSCTHLAISSPSNSQSSIATSPAALLAFFFGSTNGLITDDQCSLIFYHGLDRLVALNDMVVYEI